MHSLCIVLVAFRNHLQLLKLSYCSTCIACSNIFCLREKRPMHFVFAYNLSKLQWILIHFSLELTSFKSYTLVLMSRKEQVQFSGILTRMFTVQHLRPISLLTFEKSRSKFKSWNLKIATARLWFRIYSPNLAIRQISGYFGMKYEPRQDSRWRPVWAGLRCLGVLFRREFVSIPLQPLFTAWYARTTLYMWTHQMSQAAARRSRHSPTDIRAARAVSTTSTAVRVPARPRPLYEKLTPRLYVVRNWFYCQPTSGPVRSLGQGGMDGRIDGGTEGGRRGDGSAGSDPFIRGIRRQRT